MIPFTQLYRHEPDKGVWGDCFRASIASLLEIKPTEVPHIYEGGDKGLGMPAMKVWLKERGLGIVEIPFATEPADVMTAMRVLNPDTFYHLTGKSRNDVAHVVVCCNDEIVHDPTIDQSGIVAPTDDGFVHVEFLIPAQILKEGAS